LIGGFEKIDIAVHTLSRRPTNVLPKTATGGLEGWAMQGKVLIMFSS
jgi:hypothetical protein